MPSKTGPTAGKEDRTTSLKLNTTSTQSASLPARISSSRQCSIAPFNLHCSRSYENLSNKVFSLPNRPHTAQCTCGLIPAHADDVRDSGDLKDNAKVMGMDEQVSRETEVAGEGEEVTGVPCACLPPIQLTSSQGDATKGLVTRPTGTSSLSSTSQPTSSATCIPCPIPNLHKGPTTLPPRSIPLPQAFANTNSQPPTQLSSKGQCTHGFVSSIPFHPPPNSQKRHLKAQPRCLRLPPVCSPTTSPFQLQHPTSLHSRSTPFSLKRRSSSLPPSFRQLKNSRNEHSRTPSKTNLTVGKHDCTLFLRFNTTATRSASHPT